ncbi:MAG: substrate-binding domain-containing protein [Bauldia sp.]|nr:substrate-binding domain-containing protein [Bauldia sp.]
MKSHFLSSVSAAVMCLVGLTAALADDPMAKVDAATLVPKGIVGPSQAGDTASDPKLAWLTDEECAAAKEKGFKVGIVMQTMNIEWSTEQVRGITDGLARCGGQVVSVTNPDFTVEKQIAQIGDMILLKPDAIISIPVDDVATAATYKKIQEAGIKLVMMDNVPAGLKHGTDYVTVVSSDSQGLGAVSAAILSPYLPENAEVGVVWFGISFYVTNERTKGFKDWMAKNRPDVVIKEAPFLNPSDAGKVAESFLTANPNIAGLFTEWSGPGLDAASAARAQGKDIPSVTINLEGDVAIELAKGGMIKGLASQVPYDQGITEANAAMGSLLGKELPPFLAYAAVPVIQNNVLQAWDTVFHLPVPDDLKEACDSNPVCAGK